MKDKLDIHLRICDTTVGLTIAPEEEEILRKASKEVNEAWDVWRKRFPDSSAHKVMAMLTLLFAKGYLMAGSNMADAESIIDSFEESLDSILLGMKS